MNASPLHSKKSKEQATGAQLEQQNGYQEMGNAGEDSGALYLSDEVEKLAGVN